MDKYNFELLMNCIKNINDKAGNAAKSAVNQLMTLRKIGRASCRERV